MERCPSGPGLSSLNSKEVVAIIAKTKYSLVRSSMCFVEEIECYWFKRPQMDTVPQPATS